MTIFFAIATIASAGAAIASFFRADYLRRQAKEHRNRSLTAARPSTAKLLKDAAAYYARQSSFHEIWGFIFVLLAVSGAVAMGF